MKYNVVSNEGEITSITVFIGSESFVATHEHPRFFEIIDEVRKADPDDAKLRDLFDLTIGLGDKFERLSERVLVRAGRIHFDGVEVHNHLTDTIARMYLGGMEDFTSLVNFMEKIETNPNPHSREHLFRWLVKHDFTICPDGDFLAYKGVSAEFRSISQGTAIVNNTQGQGHILNLPGTIVEMPRDQVTFDSHIGCSTGLHAGNWRYARDFSRDKVLRVKINPRDVVSVPVDSNDEKLRVCRYRVLDEVTAEDRSLLYLGTLHQVTQALHPLGDHPVGDPQVDPADDPQVTPETTPDAPPATSEDDSLPAFYEMFNRKQFLTQSYNQLRWLAKEWEITGLGSNPAKDDLVKALVKTARKRKATWGQDGPEVE